jgi:arylsulfatase A-like enzyme
MANPNILVFYTDQQRWDTCAGYRSTPVGKGPDGLPLDITPSLDRLASEGVRFHNAFTCQPVRGPARAALQTGGYPTAIGCFQNHRMPPLDAVTVPRFLASAG